jgi:magnesium transporter
MAQNPEPRVAAWVKTETSGPLRPLAEGLLPTRRDRDTSGGAGRWVWVDVTAPSPDLVLDLGQRFHLPDHVVEDALDTEIFPKWEDHDDRFLAVFHLPTTGEDGDVDTMPVVCVISEDLLLTFHQRPNPGLDWFLEAASTHAVLVEGGPDRTLGRLTDFAAREFHPLVEGCDIGFDALSDRALLGDRGVLSDTQALRRDATLLRSVLGPQREMVLGLAMDDSPLLSDDARRRLRDAYDRHARLVEELDAARVMLASVADTYRAAVAERTNDVMKVLTVFSAMLLPLTVIVGIYGMNFEHMPELSRRWAYPAVLAVMASIVVSLWVYFVRRGFISRPRVAAVGRGVAHAARIPVRTVGSLVLRSGGGPAPAGAGRTRADLDRETIEIVADLFRLGWKTPHTILGDSDHRGAPPNPRDDRGDQ